MRSHSGSKSRFAGLVLGLGILVMGLLSPTPAWSAAGSTAGGTILISAPLGSGHTYVGTWNPCSGAFAATGTTPGYQGLDTENVTGSFLNGVLSYTSVYAGDIFDGVSGYYRPYTYTLKVDVVGGSFSGDYYVVKTPVGGTAITEGPYSVIGGWVDAKTNAGVTCAAPDSLTNHGQYVSGATKAGIKGQELAKIAKDKTLVGPYPG